MTCHFRVHWYPVLRNAAMLPCVDCAQWDMGSTAATRHMEPWTQEDNENIAMGDSVIHTPSSNPEPINITWSFPILDVFNSKPKKDRFWGLVWKKEHRSWFLPFGTLRAFWSGKNRSKSVKKSVQNRSEAKKN